MKNSLELRIILFNKIEKNYTRVYIYNYIMNNEEI